MWRGLVSFSRDRGTEGGGKEGQGLRQGTGPRRQLWAGRGGQKGAGGTEPRGWGPHSRPTASLPEVLGRRCHGLTCQPLGRPLGRGLAWEPAGRWRQRSHTGVAKGTAEEPSLRSEELSLSASGHQAGSIFPAGDVLSCRAAPARPSAWTTDTSLGGKAEVLCHQGHCVPA